MYYKLTGEYSKKLILYSASFSNFFERFYVCKIKHKV